MQPGYISFEQSTIHYIKSGGGNKILICFHGYGESASNFNFLSEKIKNDFTIIAIDLPFHGETEWKGASIGPNDFRSIIYQIIQKENLQTSQIHLMGFSLGGRIALSIFEIMPSRVDRLVLLAPDGLKMNFWYWLSTQTKFGNKCLQWTMDSPGWFLVMLRAGNKLKLINRSIYKFVEYYIHDEQVRKELYDRWTCMRKCKPNLSRIRSAIKKYQTAVRLLYGSHDRIILTSPANRFTEHLNDVRMEMLNCGHQVLHSKNADNIVRALID